MSKSENDFQASIQILEKNLEVYYSGTKEIYRVIATELRKLLCDRNPLLSRVRPEFRMHKLHFTDLLNTMPESMKGSLDTFMPGRLTIKEGTSKFELLFSKSDEGILMAPEDWIKQAIISPEITIRELVKSVADKEGAHSDPEYNDTLIKAKLTKYVSDESHIPIIVAIGEYLLNWLRDNGQIKLVG